MVALKNAVSAVQKSLARNPCWSANPHGFVGTVPYACQSILRACSGHRCCLEEAKQGRVKRQQVRLGLPCFTGEIEKGGPRGLLCQSSAQRSFLWLWLPARACCSLLPPRVLPESPEARVLPAPPLLLPLLPLLPLPPWLLAPASRASSEVNSCALPEACAARPPSAAISRWRSLSIDANPRPEPDPPWLLPWLPPRLPLWF